MISESHAERDRRGKQPPIRGQAFPDSFLPLDEEEQQERHEEQVKGVRICAQGNRPGLTGQGQREARGHADQQSTGQPGHGHSHQGDRPGDEKRGQQVRPQGLVAERLEEDGRDPGEHRVRRVAGWVGDPEHRTDRLELGLCPRNPRPASGFASTRRGPARPPRGQR